MILKMATQSHSILPQTAPYQCQTPEEQAIGWKWEPYTLYSITWIDEQFLRVGWRLSLMNPDNFSILWAIKHQPMFPFSTASMLLMHISRHPSMLLRMHASPHLPSMIFMLASRLPFTLIPKLVWLFAATTFSFAPILNSHELFCLFSILIFSSY